MALVKVVGPEGEPWIREGGTIKNGKTIEISWDAVEGATGYKIFAEPAFTYVPRKKPLRKRISVFRERMGWLWSDFKFAVRMLHSGD